MKPLELIIGATLMAVGIGTAAASGPENLRELGEALKNGSYSQIGVASLPFVYYAAMVLGGLGALADGFRSYKQVK